MAAYDPNFSWKVAGLQSVDAGTAGRVFKEIEESGEELTPQAVVNASRDEDAPLHKEFEWRDDIAAEKYRCQQAQSMIRNLVIVNATDEEEHPKYERAYVSTPGGKNVYHTIQATLNNEVWKEHLLMTAKREMEQFIAKYRRIESLAGVISAMEHALSE